MWYNVQSVVWSGIKSSKTKDFCDMSNDLLKFVADLLVFLLTTLLVNSRLAEGVFPDSLIAKLMQTYMCGDVREAASYRPILVVPFPKWLKR